MAKRKAVPARQAATPRTPTPNPERRRLPATPPPVAPGQEPDHGPRTVVPRRRARVARAPLRKIDPRPQREAPKIQAQPGGRVRVRATRMCYYNHKRRRPGDVFDLRGPHDFNPRRMEQVTPRTALRESTSKQHLQKAHDELLAQKMAGAAIETGRDDAPDDLVDTGGSPLDD